MIVGVSAGSDCTTVRIVPLSLASLRVPDCVAGSLDEPELVIWTELDGLRTRRRERRGCRLVWCCCGNDREDRQLW